MTLDPAGDDPEEPNYTGTLEGNTFPLTKTGENPLTGAQLTVTIVARR